MEDLLLRPIEGSFDASLFQPRYQRNNKRGGLKNLRCFPTCAAQHKERGFCGRPVFITLQSPEGDGLLTWAEFVKSDEPKGINVGHTISIAQADALSRSKDEPLKPWIKGSFAKLESGATVFEFNREKRGWHYGWASNKHTCNASHVLVAWIFERHRTDPDQLLCRGVIESPPFMLFCRRRRRFTLVPSAPIAEPRSAKARKAADLEEDEEDEEDEDEEDLDDEEEYVKPTKVASASKARRKSSVTPAPAAASAVATSSKRVVSPRKRNKLEIVTFPEWPSEGGAKTSSSVALGSFSATSLDKNRVDALLSLLLVAWRKLKDAEGGAPHSETGAFMAPFDSTPHGARHATSSSSAAAVNLHGSPIAAQIDNEFYQMLDILSGDLEFEGLNLEPINVGGGGPSGDEEQVELDPDVEALAEYLLKEPDFRQSVLWLRGQGSHPDFNAFIGILRDHVYKFMRERLWTLADIDRLIEHSLGHNQLQQPKSEPGTPWFHLTGADETFSWDDAAAAEGAGGRGSTTPREITVGESQYKVPNISGMWKQTRESQQAMEQVREKSGSSWVMSKIFEFMESKFTIQQNGLELSCRLWPMPALKFVLDGEEHPWGIRFPLFQPNWTYRAWTDGKVITLQHQIENRRLTRKYWCDSNRRVLYSEATLEVYDAFDARFVEESRVLQTAERIS